MIAHLLLYVLAPSLGGGLFVAARRRKKRKAEQVEESAKATLETYGSLLSQAQGETGMWERMKASAKARAFHRRKVKKHALQIYGKG